jgi:hypothetical protein
MFRDKNLHGKLEDIKDKLKELKEKDTKYRIYGSETHNYKSVRVSEDEISYLEEVDLGVKLPEEFRLFLKEIGYGAGPGHGIFGLGEISQRINEIRIDYPDYKPAKPFSDKGNVWSYCGRPDFSDGSIPICDVNVEYCNCVIHLVTCGSLLGTVWVYINGDELIDSADPKPLPTFFQWYECWLDDSLFSLPKFYPSRYESGKKIRK